MIDSLNGEVLSIGLDHAVIECSGVGYRFLATPLTLGRLTRGEQSRVMTTMVVKDDGVTLYGFGDPEAREMFHKLQTVSGLGPKLALAALSVFDAGELSAHIASGDAKSIQTVPKPRFAVGPTSVFHGCPSTPAGACGRSIPNMRQ